MCTCLKATKPNYYFQHIVADSGRCRCRYSHRRRFSNNTHSKTFTTTNAQNIFILQTFTSFSAVFSWKWILYGSNGAADRRTGVCVMQWQTFWIEVDVSIHELITTLNGFISMVFVCVCLTLFSLSLSFALNGWNAVKENVYLPCADGVHLTPLSKAPIRLHLSFSHVQCNMQVKIASINNRTRFFLRLFNKLCWDSRFFLRMLLQAMYNFGITSNRWVKMHSNWYHCTCVTIEKICLDNPHRTVLTHIVCVQQRKDTKETICYSVHRHYHFYSSSSKKRETDFIFLTLFSSEVYLQWREKSHFLCHFEELSHGNTFRNISRQIYTDSHCRLTHWLCWLLCLLRNKENFRIAVMCNMK